VTRSRYEDQLGVGGAEAIEVKSGYDGVPSAWKHDFAGWCFIVPLLRLPGGRYVYHGDCAAPVPILVSICCCVT